MHLSILLALLPMLAQAQPVCSWWGARGQAVYVAGDAACAVWVCRSADRYAGWTIERACVAPSLLSDAAFGALTAAADRRDVAAMAAQRDTALTAAPFARAMSKSRVSYKAPSGPWVVATNGTSATRPARLLLGTAMPYALGAEQAARATVGATCDCTRRFISGTTAWCAVPAMGPVQIAAVCREVAP